MARRSRSAVFRRSTSPARAIKGRLATLADAPDDDDEEESLLLDESSLEDDESEEDDDT